jgi:uncharacterized protein (DUF1499 family)
VNPYWFAPSIAIAVPLIVGPLGAYLGILEPATGFMLLGLAALLAVVSALLLPGLAAFAAATGRPWRGSALRAAIFPVLVVLPALTCAQLADAPLLHDVSTDLDDPPALGFEAELPAEQREAQRALLRDAGPVQRRAYPDLVPVELDLPPAATYQRALRVARAMPRWELGAHDPCAGRIEVVATTRVFRFADDVVIRVRARPGGSRLDVRSRSRVGRGDLGANAARIRSFVRAFRRAGDAPDPGEPLPALAADCPLLRPQGASPAAAP